MLPCFSDNCILQIYIKNVRSIQHTEKWTTDVPKNACPILQSALLLTPSCSNVNVPLTGLFLALTLLWTYLVARPTQIEKSSNSWMQLRNASAVEKRHWKPSQIWRWMKARHTLANPEAANHNSLHAGRASILAPLENQLMRLCFKLREQSLIVSVWLCTLKAWDLSAAFRQKTERAKDIAARRLLVSNKIVLRAAITYKYQQPPQMLRQEALDFITSICSKVNAPNRNYWFDLNMNQMHIFFEMLSGRTLTTAGKRTVNGRTLSSSPSRVTIAVTAEELNCI